MDNWDDVTVFIEISYKENKSENCGMLGDEKNRKALSN